MLTVGIECDDHFGITQKRELDAGLQRGALPEVDRMLKYDRAAFGSHPRGHIRRAVVDHHDPMRVAPEFGDDAADDSGFVVGRNDHPNAALGLQWHGTNSRSAERSRSGETRTNGSRERPPRFKVPGGHRSCYAQSPNK